MNRPRCPEDAQDALVLGMGILGAFAAKTGSSARLIARFHLPFNADPLQTRQKDQPMISWTVIDREEKLRIMERLRAEGRWDEACELRERQRVLNREEGMNRRDAVEKAWWTMRENFPDFYPRLPSFLVQVGYYPPRCFSKEARLRCIAIWCVYFRLMATLHRFDNTLMPHDRYYRSLRRSDLREEPSRTAARSDMKPSEEQVALPPQSIDGVAESEVDAVHKDIREMIAWVGSSDAHCFLDLVELTFTRQIQDIPGETEYEERVQRELQHIVDLVPLVRTSATEHWVPERNEEHQAVARS